MAKTNEQGSQWQRYALISLRAGESANVPGKGEKVTLINVEGFPHVGGIDVRYIGAGYDLEDSEGRLNMGRRNNPDGGLDVVITVPWYKIKQAERVSEGEA